MIFPQSRGGFNSQKVMKLSTIEDLDDLTKRLVCGDIQMNMWIPSRESLMFIKL